MESMEFHRPGALLLPSLLSRSFFTFRSGDLPDTLATEPSVDKIVSDSQPNGQLVFMACSSRCRTVEVGTFGVQRPGAARQHTSSLDSYP